MFSAVEEASAVRRAPEASGEALYVVVPVYNEEACIADVIRDWTAVLGAAGVPHRVLVLNDGSRDKTREIAAQLALENPCIEVVDKPNSGHGQTCIVGYRLAIQRGATWIFQIDGDGQCDPQYFPGLWAKRLSYPVVLGRRVARADGTGRRLISWFCRLATRMASGVPVRDPNVPYRLMRADVLACAIEEFPTTFGLANVLVSVVLQQGLGERVAFERIGFRGRQGGEPSVRWKSFAAAGVQLYRSLRDSRSYAATRALALRALMAEPLVRGPPSRL